MKLPPASANALNIFWLSAFDAPQPQSSPNVMVPRHNSETCNPLWPSNLYLILFSIGTSPKPRQGLDPLPTFPFLDRFHTQACEIGIEHRGAFLRERRAAIILLFPNCPVVSLRIEPGVIQAVLQCFSKRTH